jgi:hypothetical protein
MPRHRAQATELEKCCQFFVGSNDESLSVVSVRINNPDRSPVGINRRDAAPTPAGFAEILSDDFPASFHTAYSHHSPQHQDQKRFADGSNQIDP